MRLFNRSKTKKTEAKRPTEGRRTRSGEVRSSSPQDTRRTEPQTKVTPDPQPIPIADKFEEREYLSPAAQSKRSSERARENEKRAKRLAAFEARSPREERRDLIANALSDAGAVKLYEHGTQPADFFTLTGWVLNGISLVVVDGPHGIDVMQSLAPGVNSTDALLDVIRRYSTDSKTLRAEARQVVEAFDEIPTDLISDLVGRYCDVHEGAWLNLVTLLGASNRLRDACGLNLKPRDDDPAES
jgi:hypothetical protein